MYFMRQTAGHTRPHVVTTQNITIDIFTVVKTSDLRRYIHVVSPQIQLCGRKYVGKISKKVEAFWLEIPITG
jgi:hypothetical protein